MHMLNNQMYKEKKSRKKKMSKRIIIINIIVATHKLQTMHNLTYDT